MGEVLRHSGGKPRYGVCFAPSEYVAGAVSSPFGRWAEGLVMTNYVAKTMAVPGVTDFLDLQPDIPATKNLGVAEAVSKTLYDFLSMRNPAMNTKAQLWYQEFKAGRTRVPDMLTHKPDHKVYYEIKPGSPSGERDGLAKLNVLRTMMSKFQLSYVAGTHYNPGGPDDVDVTQRMPQVMNLYASRIGLRKIKVTFTFRRPPGSAGLILYWVCIDMETEDELEDAVVENIGRWYVLHIVREMKRAVPLRDSVIEPELNLPMPTAARYVPQGLALMQMLMRAPPAPAYALLGGPELRNIILHENMERQKAMLQIRLGNVSTATLAFRDNTLLVMAAIPALTGIFALVSLAGAHPGAGATGAAGAVAAPAVVTLGATGGTGAVVLPFAARAAASPATKAISMAAGVVCMVTFGKAGVASAAPIFAQAEAVRAVPLTEITSSPRGTLGDATLKDGSSGVMLGTLRLPGLDDLFMPLTPHLPPA